MAVKYIKKVRKKNINKKQERKQERPAENYETSPKSEALRLSRPIMSLSGESIHELHFAFGKLTPKDYRQIVRLESRLRGDQLSFDVSIETKKTNSEFRMASAWIAALRGTPGLCLDDIDALALIDLLELEEVGCFFMARLA